MLHVQLILGSDIPGLEIDIEVETREEGVQLSAAARVVKSLHITVLKTGPGHFREARLHCKGFFRSVLRLLYSTEFKHFGEIAKIAFTDIAILFIKIVVPVTYSKTALTERENLNGTIHKV